MYVCLHVCLWFCVSGSACQSGCLSLCTQVYAMTWQRSPLCLTIPHPRLLVDLSFLLGGSPQQAHTASLGPVSLWAW